MNYIRGGCPKKKKNNAIADDFVLPAVFVDRRQNELIGGTSSSGARNRMRMIFHGKSPTPLVRVAGGVQSAVGHHVDANGIFCFLTNVNDPRKTIQSHRSPGRKKERETRRVR